jgi:predicted transcriptional regulator YdeE
VPAEKLRYDAAVTITRRIDVPDDMVIAGLPAMEWAMTTHKGSFAGMTDTFMALGRELGTRKDLVGTFHCGLEIYGPMTGNEADLRTELGLPVVRIS